MKLGLLSFATPQEPRLARVLEAAGHTIVPAEAAAVSGVSTAEEAARMARADCDGVVLCFFADDETAAALETVPGLVVQAALHAACPVLLAGDDLPVLLAVSGALAEIGVTPGQAFGAPGDPATLARIQAWAGLHDPAERRRGQDAAGKLFGSRYAILGDPPPGNAGVFVVDAARWLTQFGVHVQHASASALAGRSVSDYCAHEGIAFCSLGGAADGALLAPPGAGGVALPAACGANGALTAQLLSLVVAGDAAVVSTLALAGYDPGFPDRLRVRNVAGDAAAAIPPATFARITRRMGRFVCLIVMGSVENTGDGAIVLRPDCGSETLLFAAAGPYLHAAPGDLRAALKAACETLDVEPILLG